MTEWLQFIQMGDQGVAIPMLSVGMALLLAFIAGQIIGWMYMATHLSPSYSASFVASLVLLPVIVALMMILMSGSLMIAFGLLAVFAVVRFRNVLKDTRDTIFILWAIVEGMGAGTFRFSTTIVGVITISLVVLYLFWTRFGERHRFDASLSVLAPNDDGTTRALIEQILFRYANRTSLTAERLAPDTRSVLSYRLLLRDPATREQLRAELSSISDVQEMSFYVNHDRTEV